MRVSARFKTRVRYHLVLSITAAILLFVFFEDIPGDDHTYLWSMASGYVSIILLAITLLIGPMNLYYGRLNPISTDLRRDIGIWCGIVGLLHVVMGIQVHMGDIRLYFFKAIDGENAFALRSDIFGSANYVGLVAALILVLLMILSNDASLKWLKPRRWKSLQRLNYVFFAGVLVHGILFQIIEKRVMPIVLLFVLIMVIPVVVQCIGLMVTLRSKQRS